MTDSKFDALKSAAHQFVSAFDVSENWVSFRIGDRAINVALGGDTDDSFTVLVDSEYEGSLRLKAKLVRDTVDGMEYKSLHLCEPEYLLSDGKRYPMPPGPAYSLLALGVVIASVFAYYLYGYLCNLNDDMRIACRLLKEINESADVPKARDWRDSQDLLERMVESYVYLIV